MRRNLCLPVKFLAIALSAATCLVSQAWCQNPGRTSEEHKVMLGAFMAEMRAKAQPSKTTLKPFYDRFAPFGLKLI